jgi:ketosteroid isomerase-like protein
MKRLITHLLVLAVFQVNAQRSFDGLINAEKSFATYSVAHGTRDAFLKFLDSCGIVFEQGKAVNGVDVWEKRKTATMILNWQPQFAEIASSNDFGYTTGPWDLKSAARPDSVIARGRFITVWHTDASGNWKCLVDLGVGNSPKEVALAVKKVSKQKVRGTTSMTDLLSAEKDFIDKYKNDKLTAYRAYLSPESILNRNGLVYPATSKNAQVQFIKDSPSDPQFEMVGSGIAPSGDLAYVYGNTVVNDKPENYLRIWRREKSGWKIALEVLRY